MKDQRKDSFLQENGMDKLNHRPNQRFVPGDSVDEHRNIEDGNIILTGDEIKQQNENL
jgi:hypothetical protein